MIAPATQKEMPLSCRWVLFRKWSDYLRPTEATRALCLRVPELPRVVTAEECRNCRLWEPPDKRES